MIYADYMKQNAVVLIGAGGIVVVLLTIAATIRASVSLRTWWYGRKVAKTDIERPN